MNLHYYIIGTTIFNTILGIAWSKNNILNLLIKINFLGFAVFGVYLILHF